MGHLTLRYLCCYNDSHYLYRVIHTSATIQSLTNWFLFMAPRYLVSVCCPPAVKVWKCTQLGRVTRHFCSTRRRSFPMMSAFINNQYLEKHQNDPTNQLYVHFIFVQEITILYTDLNSSGYDFSFG